MGYHIRRLSQLLNHGTNRIKNHEIRGAKRNERRRTYVKVFIEKNHSFHVLKNIKFNLYELIIFYLNEI
jgi:hypothetical protein